MYSRRSLWILPGKGGVEWEGVQQRGDRAMDL